MLPPSKYSPNYDSIIANKRAANFKRDPRPQRGHVAKDDKKPGPVTYKVETKDLGKIVSNRKRCIVMNFGAKDK